MYKKLTCALCFVISIFIIAVVVYLLMTKTDIFSEKPPEIKVPKLSILLVNATTGHEKVLHKTPNSDFILDFRSLDLIDAEDVESSYKSSRRNLLRIRCHSNYPVQLKYNGFGNLTTARNYNRRQIEAFDDRSTYTYSTEIDLTTVDQAVTGKYDCEVRDETILKASTSVYIYATGSKPFVSQYPREVVVEPGKFIEVPCPVTHPNKSITLLSVIQIIQGIIQKEVEPERVSLFDPKRGFILHPNNWGSYLCQDQKTSEVSGRVTVFMPLNSVVKGRTLRVTPQNVNNTDRTLKLECKAKEPVELKFINFARFSKKQREMKDDSEFPYAVRIKLDTEYFRGNISIVECITKKDRRVVKTWKYINQEEIPKGNYDTSSPQVFLRVTKQKGYQCCSGDMRPVLRTYPCHTPTECELRTPCLSFPTLRSRITANCPLYEAANEAIYEGDKGCTLLQTNNNRSGIIRCSMDSAIRDYAFFSGFETDGTYFSTSTLMSKKKLDPEAVMRITQTGFRSPNVSKIRFECVGSKLHLASGFQWGLERLNEPIKYLRGERTESQTVLHHEWIDVLVTDRTSKRMFCIAPLINPPLFGEQWFNVSTTFRY